MDNATTYTKVASYEGRKGEVKRVVLLYSGGLDTSVMLKWIQDEYQAEVIALTIDIGQQVDDLEEIRKKALTLGASKAIVVDAKDEFADRYLSRAIKFNASYQGPYHLSTPLGRPLLAKIAVQVAAEEDADCIAHGATGKGNDQVRIEGSALALNPDIKVIAPVREWNMGRDEELAYAKRHRIPVKQTAALPYSWDDNMWGVTGEGGEIENPALVPPLQKILQVCAVPWKAKSKPAQISLEFVKGIPVALNGRRMKLAELIMKLNTLGAAHAVGFTHHIEDRVVGLKVRGVYEAPAAEILIQAHQNLEKYVSTRNENEFKAIIDQKFAYLCYGALWYDPLMADLEAFTNKVNDKVSGTVTVMLYRGRAEVVALETPNTLFDEKLATFNKSNAFNVNASAGFTEIYTMQMKLAKLNALHLLVALGGNEAKQLLLPSLRALVSASGVRLYATEHTHDFLRQHGLTSQIVGKLSEKRKEAPNIAGLMRERRFDLVINVPKHKPGTKVTTDGRVIRDLAVQQGIELVTEIDVAQMTLQKLAERKRS